MMQDRILVIIITHNGMKWIDKCIQSVLASTIHTNIFIIDNGSTDNTVEHIKKNYPNVKINVNAQNLGFGQANNIGLQYAIDNDYDYVYLLNQDAWIKPNTLKTLINVHKENPDYGVISPIQLQANEKHFDLNFRTIIMELRGSEDFTEDAFFKSTKDVYPVPRVMAAHWLISKSCLSCIGGFSPTFYHYGEDHNYADRAWEKKFKVGIVPNAIAIHDRENRKSTKQQQAHFRYCMALNGLSDFKTSTKKVFFDYCYELLISILYNRYDNKIMIKNFIKLLVNFKHIKRNKMLSTADCAFLKNTPRNQRK